MKDYLVDFVSSSVEKLILLIASLVFIVAMAIGLSLGRYVFPVDPDQACEACPPDLNASLRECERVANDFAEIDKQCGNLLYSCREEMNRQAIACRKMSGN